MNDETEFVDRAKSRRARLEVGSDADTGTRTEVHRVYLRPSAAVTSLLFGRSTISSTTSGGIMGTANRHPASFTRASLDLPLRLGSNGFEEDFAESRQV